MSNHHLEFPESFAMCSHCTGTGKTRCGICGGRGSHTQTRYEYDRDGRSTSRLEDVNCGSCAGDGYRSCSICAGTGSVMKPRSSPGRAKATTLEPDESAAEIPASDKEIEALYDEAVVNARAAQEDLIEELGRLRAKHFPRGPLISFSGDLGKVDPKVEERYARVRAWYSELSRWVADLDPVTEKTHGEVTEAINRLKAMGEEDIAFWFGSLEATCSTAATYARILKGRKAKG